MRVVVAMSGGVDSSVVAGLLAEAGHEVIGVHMKLHDVPAHPSSGDKEAARGSKHCCGLDDALDARRVADRLGVPFYAMDLRAPFKSAVMDYFADSYLAGATPIPCIPCNGVLKFNVLLKRARALGADALATGHYARIGPDGGLLAARDRDKDQSYFLFGVGREALARTRFPLGGLEKAEVREHARRLGLGVADKPESQEICFIPDEDHTRFVREHRPVQAADGAGLIVDESGHELGRHDGYWRYTIGQRRGLGIAAGHPLYVLSIDAASRRVVVGPADRLQRRGVISTGMNWLRAPGVGTTLTARLRHRGALHPCSVEDLDGLELHDPSLLPAAVRVRFDAGARAPTPGQALVLYDGEVIVGGGWIKRALP